MLSVTTDMEERQGLIEDKWYEAMVVENDDRKHPDKMMLGRIQARILVIFDGVPDINLPWAVPVFDHPEGASEITGYFSVPKKATKVFLRFQGGNPAFPMYRGFHVDKVTQMDEIKFNYPNRTVRRFSNKGLMVHDTQDNVLYLRMPGDVKIYVEGRVEIEVQGDVDELIRGSVRRTIMGNFHDTVFGQRHILTGKLKAETTMGQVHEFSSGIKTVESSGGEVHVEGPMIYENSSRTLGIPPLPIRAKMSKWPGIPGGAKGTNVRNAIDSKDATVYGGEKSSEEMKRTANPDISSHMPQALRVTQTPGSVTSSGNLPATSGGSTQLPEFGSEFLSHFGSNWDGTPDRSYVAPSVYPTHPIPA